jgi:membrane associated rhomboid family serine protease
MNENSKYLRSIAYAVAIFPILVMGTVATWAWFFIGAMSAGINDDRMVAGAAIGGVITGIVAFVFVVIFAVKSLNALSVKTWGLETVKS